MFSHKSEQVTRLAMANAAEEDDEPPVHDRNGPKQKTRRLSPLHLALKSIVDEFEVTRPVDISVMAVVKRYGLKHRRVYDFFNLLDSLGVCIQSIRGKFAWVGLSAVNKKICESYAKVEVSSMDQPMRALFHVGPSPKLGTIAKKVICLYMYLGLDTLHLEHVCALLYDLRSKRKSLQRRIYQVFDFLGAMRLTGRSKNTGEYRLLMDTAPIVSQAMKAKRDFAGQSPLNVEAMLSNLDQAYMSTIFRERQQRFKSLARGVSQENQPEN